MLRSLTCTSVLIAGLSGCFQDPPQSGSAGSSGDAGSTSSDPNDGSTTSSGIGADETSFGTTGSSSGLAETTFFTSSGQGTSPGSTGTDDSSSTGEPEMFCGCPPAPLLCEDFEEFDGSTFPGWVVPSPGLPPQQVDALCGQAFRGEIEPGEGFAVVSRQFPAILEVGDTDVIRLSGVMQVAKGCASQTPHRLVSARADGFNDTFLYSADIELADGFFRLVQRVPDPGTAEVITLGPAEEDVPLRFEIMLVGLQFAKSPTVTARVGMASTSAERPFLPPDGLSFNAVPGPFAYLDASLAGCSIDFDDLAVEALSEPPPFP